MFADQPPAKLNLTLAVGPRGADGYHSLRSVFVALELADRLTVAPGDGERDTLEIAGLPGCPVEGNLVLRAFDALQAAAAVPLPPLAARLEKRIPIGAGLGGGSSDGASALALAAAGWGIGISPAERARLALTLGSDVPFFVAGHGAALVEGRGEKITPLPDLAGDGGIVLCLGSEQLATAAVYRRFDELAGSDGAAGEATDALAAALRAGLGSAGLAAQAERLRDANDLWPAAASLAPALPVRRAELERLTGRPWLMTGSGPTLFAIYDNPAEAAAGALQLATAMPDVAPIATRLAAGADKAENADSGAAR